MSALEQAAPGIAMIAALVLAWFGVRLARRPDTRTKGVLMVVMAAVLVGNVLIWTLPAHAAPKQENPPRSGDDGIEAAVRALNANDCPKALSAVEPLVTAEAAERLAPPTRSAAYSLAAMCKVDTGDLEGGYRYALDGTRFDNAGAPLWMLRLDTELRRGRDAPAVATIEEMATRDGEALGLVAIRALYAFDRRLDTAGEDELRLRLLRVLTSGAYRPLEVIAPLDGFLRDYATLLKARGDDQGAAAQLRLVTEPSVALDLWVDPRFRSELPADFDIRVVTERALAEVRATAANHPELLEPLNVAARYLLALDRPAEALALLDTARAGGKSPASFSDAATQLNWWWNELARSHAALGHADQAIAALREGGAAAEDGGLNVSQLINLAGLQLSVGRPADALTTLWPFAASGRPASSYGEAEMRLARGCANHLLGNRDKAAQDRDFLIANESDNPRALGDLLLCMEDLDGAAAVFARSLADPDRRAATLLRLSEFDAPAIAMPEDPVDRHLPTLRARADMKAAIARAGGTLRIPLQHPPV